MKLMEKPAMVLRDEIKNMFLALTLASARFFQALSHPFGIWLEQLLKV